MKIKNVFLIGVGLLGASATMNAQKAAVTSAYMYNKSYERDKDCSELEKGIKTIGPATTDIKTGKYAKTWYYGGNLYFNAALTQDQECAAKFPEALENSFEYYLTALKYNIEEEGASDLDLDNAADQMKFMMFLQNKDTKYDDVSYMRDIIDQKFPYLANAFINKGVEEFQAKNYEKAMEYSGNSVAINSMLGRVDSLGMYNAALAAERLDKKDEALAMYTALTQINYGGPDIYLYIANIHDRNKDTTKKIEAIRKGLEVYPTNADLVREELNYLLLTGQTEEALKNFDKAIDSDPDNSSLYYNRGLINDQLSGAEGVTAEDQEKFRKAAAADYSKALEMQPDFFDAAYNLGAMYYNIGVEWNNKASSYGLNESAKYDAASKKANEFFALARPALEKAHAINAEDKSTMASLTKIYAIEGETELYTKMKAKLQGK